MKMMRRLGIGLALSVLLSYILVASVLATVFYATIIVQESSGNSYAMLGLVAPNNNTYLATNGYISANGTDVQITKGSVAVPRLLSDNATLFAIPVGASSSTSLQWTTNNTISDFSIVTGYNGSISTANDTDLDIGNSGNYTWNGWFDPTSTGNLLRNIEAISIWGNGSGNVTAGIGDGRDLLYATVSSQYSSKDAGVVSPAGGNITIDAWFYVNALTGLTQGIVGDGDTNPPNNCWFLRMNNTQHIEFYVRNTAGAAWATAWIQTGTVTLGVWHFITAVYDNTAVTKTLVYVDGASVAGADAGGAGTIYQPNTFLAVGALRGVAYDSFFNGYIDEVRITQGARTLAEHIAAYNNGWGIPFTVDGITISLWHFNEGAGNPLDSNAGTNNLVRVNNPTWSANSHVGFTYAYSAVISAAEHTIGVYLTGGNLGIVVDGVTSGTPVVCGANVTINANPMVWNTGNIMPYCNYITVYKAGVQKLLYQPDNIIAGVVLPDRINAGGFENGVITWGVNPTGVAVTFGSLEMTATTVSAPGLTSPSVVGTVGLSDAIHKEDSELRMLAHEYYTIVADVASLSNLTPEMIWWFLSAVLALAALTVVRVNIPSSMLAGFVMVAVMAAFVSMAGGSLEWWMPAVVLLGVFSQMAISKIMSI